jgi:hypothetical protein
MRPFDFLPEETQVFGTAVVELLVVGALVFMARRRRRAQIAIGLVALVIFASEGAIYDMFVAPAHNRGALGFSAGWKGYNVDGLRSWNVSPYLGIERMRSVVLSRTQFGSTDDGRTLVINTPNGPITISKSCRVYLINAKGSVHEASPDSFEEVWEVFPELHKTLTLQGPEGFRGRLREIAAKHHDDVLRAFAEEP